MYVAFALVIALLTSIIGRAPILLTLEQYTTLRVGQTAVLSIPSDRRYDRYGDSNSLIDGAWSDVLSVIDHSQSKVTFRATKAGNGVLLLSPDPGAQDDNCISCATLHYFVTVLPKR